MTWTDCLWNVFSCT